MIRTIKELTASLTICNTRQQIHKAEYKTEASENVHKQHTYPPRRHLQTYLKCKTKIHIGFLTKQLSIFCKMMHISKRQGYSHVDSLEENLELTVPKDKQFALSVDYIHIRPERKSAIFSFFLKRDGCNTSLIIRVQPFIIQVLAINYFWNTKLKEFSMHDFLHCLQYTMHALR